MRLSNSLLLVVLLTGGCAGRRNVDLLEAKLREQEDQIRSLHAQVRQVNSELTAARHLNESLKQQVVRPASLDQSFDLDELHFRVAGLKINTLLTGGFDRDGRSGDDQITLFFTAVDDQERTVHVPGRVECELLDPAQPADQQRLGLWTFDSKQTHAAWVKTLGSFGYRIELPWQTPPQSRNLTLHVRLHSANGSRFETSTPIQIVLP
jgi:outer membrane murein-binding lipoprotein Lpp